MKYTIRCIKFKGIYFIKATGNIRFCDGDIKRWKGYGFIETDNDGDIFVHRSGIEEYGFFGLQKFDWVSFEIKETPKGKHAAEPRLTEGYVS
jgi:CspA family cold shock protein